MIDLTDPLTLAIVTGLAIPTAKDIITDGYQAFKEGLKQKFIETQVVEISVNNESTANSGFTLSRAKKI